MGQVGLVRAVGLFRRLFWLGALPAAPLLLGAGCGDVSVVEDGVAPTLLSVEPAEGPSEGGSLVVLTGRDLDEDVVVRFGGEKAPSVTWIDRQTVNAVTPPGQGAVSVSVENHNHKVSTLEAAFTYTGGGTGCVLLASTPEAGASGVPITGELRLTYSAPLDVASLEDAVKLRLLGTDEEVPLEVKLDATTDADVIVRPKKSLRFWGTYALTTAAGVEATDGSSCAPGAVAFATIHPEALPRPLRAAPVSGLALAKDGTPIAASEGYRGFQTYALAGADTKVASDLLTSFGPRNIVVRGDRAYAPSGLAGVRILDVSDPLAPKEIGHGGTPGRALDVAVVEKGGRTYLLVADYDGGARVLDATDPAAVADVGTLDLGAADLLVTQVDAQGDRVVVAEGTHAILLDLPDPGDLASQVSHGVLNVGATASDVLLDGDRLFVGKGQFGVASYDVTNPEAPVPAGSGEDPDGPCPSGCANVAARLAKDGDDLFVAYARGGVVRYTVSAAGALTWATNYKVKGDVRSVAVTASRVLAGGEEGLVVFDRAGDGAAPLWVDPAAHGRARGVRVRDGFAYVAAFLSGVQVFALDDPEAPALVNRLDTPGSPVADEASAGVSSDGAVLAVADGRAGVTFFDLTDPAAPAPAGTLDTSDAVRVVASAGSVVYACNDNQGLVAVDATDPKAPALLGEAAFTDVSGGDACRDLAPAGGLVYVARSQGLGVLDASDPAALAWKKLVALPGGEPVAAVRKVGDHLLVTTTRFDYEGIENNTSRLHVLDLADPLDPVLVWSSAELGRASGIAVVGDVAFVAVAGAGVAVFDISDVAAPVHEGNIATDGNVTFVAPGASVLYAAEGAGGLQAIRTGPLPAP